MSTLPANATLFLSPLQDGYSQIYIRQTEVFRSVNGTESRRQLLDDTLIGVNAKFKTYNRQQTQMMDSIIYFAKTNNDIMWVPLWFSKTTLASAASTSSADIVVGDATLEGFANGASLMMSVPSGMNPTSEKAVISSISSNTITLTGTPSFPFPANSVVVPLREMKIDTVSKSSGARPQHFEYSVSATEVT